MPTSDSWAFWLAMAWGPRSPSNLPCWVHTASAHQSHSLQIEAPNGPRRAAAGRRQPEAQTKIQRAQHEVLRLLWSVLLQKKLGALGGEVIHRGPREMQRSKGHNLAQRSLARKSAVWTWRRASASTSCRHRPVASLACPWAQWDRSREWWWRRGHPCNSEGGRKNGSADAKSQRAPLQTTTAGAHRARCRRWNASHPARLIWLSPSQAVGKRFWKEGPQRHHPGQTCAAMV